MSIVLDHVDQITVDPYETRLPGVEVALVHRSGLFFLAAQMREQEQTEVDLHGMIGGEMWPAESVKPEIYCSFNWFSTALVSYLRLVSLIAECERLGWGVMEIGENAKHVKKAGDAYVAKVAPAVGRWRNAVGAHATATDSRPRDNPAVLLHSLSYPVYRHRGIFSVGGESIRIGEHVKAPDWWSVTGVFESLAPRLWPDLSLKPLIRGSADDLG